MVRELSLRVVVIGLVLSVVMAAANVYLGLKAGMTVSASIPAAVVGMLILRGLFRDGTILEANQIQTTASAGESLAAGIIFTMPALILIGAWESFDLVTTTVIAFTGGLLGILFMIPMRRVFVIDNEDLKYPEGVACAAVLEAGDAEHEGSAGDAKSVIIGASIGALLKFLAGYFKVLLGTLEAAAVVGGRVLFIGADISPALVGVGFIVRLNVAVLVFIGGAVGWLVCMPLLPEINALLEAVGGALGVAGLGAMPELPADSVDRAWAVWSTRIRYIGVGAMVVGGVSSIITVRHGLVSAVTELRKRRSAGPDDAVPDTDRDLPSRVILALSLLAVLLIGGIYYSFTGGIGITLLTTAIMIVMAFFFVAVASYIVGLVGNSNSPVSGMTITAVLFTGAMLFVFGFSGEQGMLATLGVAAIVCCAACTSGDVCNDLKTGEIVGAAPFRQQTMQIAGVAVAALVMAPVLQLLHESYGIGSRELSAPQAGLFASLAEGFFGDGELPWGMVGVGVVIGIVIDLIDKYLARRGSHFRAHLMPVAVGMYLPFGLAIPILAGGVLAHFHGKGASDDGPALDKRLHRGVLFSSGIIAGESLVGVVIALLVWLSLGFEAPDLPFASGLTLAVALGVMGLFWKLTRPSAETADGEEGTSG